MAGKNASGVRNSLCSADRAGLVSLVLVVINFCASGGVQEAFQTMLSIAVVLQLVPFIYMFAALLKFAFGKASEEGRYSRGLAVFAGSERVHHHDRWELRWRFSRPSRSRRSEV